MIQYQEQDMHDRKRHDKQDKFILLIMPLAIMHILFLC